MEPDIEDLKQIFQEEEIKINQNKEKNEFKNKIGKQRRNCWWN